MTSDIGAILGAGEQIVVHADAVDARLAVTDKRLAIVSDERVTLAVPFHELRRIQFDIERGRPATLVVVPERPTDEPQVLSIPPRSYEQVGRALAIIGQRLTEPRDRSTADR